MSSNCKKISKIDMNRIASRQTAPNVGSVTTFSKTTTTITENTMPIIVALTPRTKISKFYSIRTKMKKAITSNNATITLPEDRTPKLPIITSIEEKRAQINISLSPTTNSKAIARWWFPLFRQSPPKQTPTVPISTRITNAHIRTAEIKFPRVSTWHLSMDFGSTDKATLEVASAVIIQTMQHQVFLTFQWRDERRCRA